MWGFVDSNGRFVVHPQFERVKDFYDGMARVRVGGLWGWMNKNGGFVVNPTFPNCFDLV